VDYVVFVTVVYARKDLLEQNCCIPFAEFPTLKHLVKQLTAFANLRNQVVTFFVFEKLVHFNDIWVVLCFIRGFKMDISENNFESDLHLQFL
jgi:hypothetical protein